MESLCSLELTFDRQRSCLFCLPLCPQHTVGYRELIGIEQILLTMIQESPCEQLTVGSNMPSSSSSGTFPAAWKNLFHLSALMEGVEELSAPHAQVPQERSPRASLSLQFNCPESGFKGCYNSLPIKNTNALSCFCPPIFSILKGHMPLV